MSIRLDLLRWVNDKCPQMKAINIESLSDGRHFLYLLRKYFPEIEVPQFKKNMGISSKIENLNLVSNYCQRLDLPVKIDFYKIANKDSAMIINVLKGLRNIFDKTPIKKAITQEECITIIKEKKNGNEKIHEEVIINETQNHKDSEEHIRQYSEEATISTDILKKILLMKLQSPYLELELLKLLKPDDQELAELQQSLQQAICKKSKCRSKITEYMSIHSSQFYNRGEGNLLEIEYSGDQNQMSKKSVFCDSLFQVSDEKNNK